MNTAANGDPMGDEYWALFEDLDRRKIRERNARDVRYGGIDPGTWGWRRPDPAELQAERLAGIEHALAESKGKG